jgi:hypothetical protein
VTGLSARSRGRASRGRQVLALVALLASALCAAPASVAATPTDIAATHALLQAHYALDVALLESAAASRASTAKLAASLGRECHGVLAGEPAEEGLTTAPAGSATPRARGERERGQRQRQTIDEELSAALGDAGYQPVRAAIQSYLAATAPLSWSDARIAPLVHTDAAPLEEAVAVVPPDVCADMKAWSQSGYRLLSPASDAFRSARASHDEQLASAGSLGALLKPFEDASAIALLRRTAALGARRDDEARLLQDVKIDSQLRRALGEQESPFEQRTLEPVLGHGKTQSGATYRVRRDRSSESRGSSCRHEVSVELEQQRSSRSGASFSSGGSGICLSHSARDRASSGCSGNEASITDVVPASVSTVRMRLSNGKVLTSAVVRIRPSDGGPAGVYVQAVRPHDAYPVLLTELDRHGHVVRVVPLTSLRCRSNGTAAPPAFFTLVNGSLPGGQQFTIQGTLVEFGHSQHQFSLNALVGSEVTNEESLSEGIVGHAAPPKAFAWSSAIGCAPRPFALVFGILAAPGDSVLARTPEGLVALSKQELASSLYSQGPLVYGAFSSLPSELIIRSSDGTTLYSESLVTKAMQESEFCEGLAEG